MQVQFSNTFYTIKQRKSPLWNDVKWKHINCTSLPTSSHMHSHILSSQAHLDISGYSAAHSLCTVLLYRYLLMYYKHTLKRITASLQWNNMYMFTYKDVDKRQRSVNHHNAETRVIRSSVCCMTGWFPSVLFVEKLHFTSWKQFLKTH